MSLQQRLSALLLLLFTFSTLSSAQSGGQPGLQPGGTANDKSGNQPARITPGETTTIELKAPDYSREAMVYEQYRTLVRFENDGTGRRDSTARIRVQSDAGVQALGQLVFGYNAANEKIEINYVRVKKSDGKVVTATADAVQDLTSPIQRDAPVYTDTREKHVTVPALRPGEVLEYSVSTITTTPYAPGQFWMSYDFEKNAIVLDEQLEINVPKGRKITLKVKPGTEASERDEGDRHIYLWKSSHKEHDEDADDANNDKLTAREKKRKKDKEAKDNEFPAIQLTTFPSWDAVGQWYAGLQKDRVIPDAEVKERALELTRDKKTEMDKFQALYDYVARNFRYVSLSLGLSRYQPHAASEVFANQYGDCKDKHTLLAAMLSAIGVKAEPALMNSSRKIDPDVPSPSQFDHVITAVPMNNELIWVDTTTEVAPFRLLSANLRDKKALLMPVSGVAKLVETPAVPPFVSSQVLTVNGKVNDFGKLNANIHWSFRGDVELVMRYSIRHLPETQWKRFAQGLDNLIGLQGDVSELKISDPGATGEPFTMDYAVAAPNFLNWSSKHSQLDLPTMNPQLPMADDDPPSDADPIQLGAPGNVTSSFKIELPKSFTPTLPLPIVVKRDYAEYSAVYKNENGLVSGERTLHISSPELPISRTRDYLAFRRTVDADQDQKLALETSGSAAPEVAGNISTDELEDAAGDALKAGNFDAAADLYNKLIKRDATRKNAYNYLGRAEMGRRKFDRAIEAFKKQIEIEPYDETAYNNLAAVYQELGKNEDAAGAYQKQIEISPLDKYAHYGLGSVFLDEKKYKDAVTELEKAVSLTPNWPPAHVALGRAYLNADQSQKAVASFDKAVEIEPSALVFNDVAYELARKQVSLDRALEYAESAVEATNSTLRNATLDHLTVQQTTLVTSLAAYWDTLGWVYFQRGELPLAEKYVRSSWLLMQHGEVGDHLGQIYEKEGRKSDAISAYAQALASLRPDPDTRGHLVHLLGSEQKVQPLVEKATPQLSTLRSVKLGKLLPPGSEKQPVSADFFVLLSPPGKVESVRYVSGDEDLKKFADTLKTSELSGAFPDNNPTKLIRRGTLSCSPASGDCTFVMAEADSITSVD
jgi:tetratricopeptide (TPR) repeat protein/transglutaminase-like putative cysteine protease